MSHQMKAEIMRLFLGVSVLLILVHGTSAQANNSLIIQTVAGTGLPTGVPATSVGIGEATGIATDATGNVYIADHINYRVMKLDLGGNLTIVAGTGNPNPQFDLGAEDSTIATKVGDGGPAVSAELNDPVAIATDGLGEIYILDYYSIVRKVDFNGIISTVAGTGVQGFSGNGGPATSAQISAQSIAVDGFGNLYLSEPGNGNNGCRIRKVDAQGIISTIAGTGVCGYSGDGGPAVNAQIYPYELVIDNSGNIYFVDNSGQGGARIRKISTSGVITTVAGTGVQGYTGDGGPALNAQISASAIAIGSGGSIFLNQYTAAQNPNCSACYVRKIDTNGIITTIAGSGSSTYSGDGGPASNAGINAFGLAVDTTGDLFLVNLPWQQDGTRIRKINTAGIINTVAGNGTNGFRFTDTTASNAFIDTVSGLVLDSTGNMYFGDWNNYRVRKVDTSGQITTIAGTGNLSPVAPCSGNGGPATSAAIGTPGGVTLDGMGNLLFADSDFGNCVRMIDFGGIIHSVAGTGSWGFSGDGGPAISASFKRPMAVAFDKNGNLYITDYYNYRVRKVDTNGIINTVVGTGTSGSSGDGGLALNAQLSNPSGLAFDTAGNLYIGDGPRVRRVDTSGFITTFAGTGVVGFSGDGGLATNAQLALVDGLSIGHDGSVYIADGNNRVRVVDLNGVISTFAGTGTFGFNGDGGAAVNAEFSHPGALAFDTNGNLYIGDIFNYRIRKVTIPPPAPVVSLAPTTLTFGGQLVTTSSTSMSATLSNTGNAALSVTSIALAGTNSGDFSQTNNCGTSVAAGANCTINITFTPTASGARTANVSVTDNAAGSPHVVSITGTGTDFSIGPANNGSTSATITAGQTATFNLQVNPISGFTGAVNLTCSGAPSLSTCTVSPSSVTVTGTGAVAFNVAVGTTARGSAGGTMSTPWQFPGPNLPVLAAYIFALLLGGASLKNARRPRYALSLGCLAILFVTSLMTACGGGGGGGGGGSSQGTPAGSYTITITGSQQGVNRTATLQLTVN